MKTALNRDDILRELELLPVWRQQSVSASLPAASINPPNPSKSAATTPSYEGIFNVQNQTLFVLASPQSAVAEALLHNMLKAIALQPSEKKPALRLDQLTTDSPRLIVAMGELVAQQLLGRQDTLENLRGSVHHYHNIALIVTYAPDDLLQDAAYKLNAWQDLCLVKSTLQGLHSPGLSPYT